MILRRTITPFACQGQPKAGARPHFPGGFPKSLKSGLTVNAKNSQLGLFSANNGTYVQLGGTDKAFLVEMWHGNGCRAPHIWRTSTGGLGFRVIIPLR